MVVVVVVVVVEDVVVVVDVDVVVLVVVVGDVLLFFVQDAMPTSARRSERRHNADFIGSVLSRPSNNSIRLGADTLGGCTTSAMDDLRLTRLLMSWQFWALEALFAAVVVSTCLEARRMRVDRRTLGAALALGAAAWLLTTTIPPRTNRIFYDEQIYQDVARNLSDLHLAQMCNDGTIQYGRLQCFRGEYNKEPYGYPYLLSILYRIGGVSESAAFHFNHAIAGVAVIVTVLLANQLFQDFPIAVASGLLLALMPMQLTWSATAAAEPSAACFVAAALVAAVHFARTRTTSALACMMLLSGFAATLRPECVLVAPLAASAIALLAPEELRRPRTWWMGGLWIMALLVAIAHAIAVRNNPWDARGSSIAWQYLHGNLPANGWFYLRDERFPAIAGAAAIVGLAASTERLRERLFLAAYFLAFWIVFIFFYAGSYNWGANVRYSLMSYVPITIFAAAGLMRVARLAGARTRALAWVAAVVVVQFLWYVPLVRATGEEAWASRADVAYAKRFAATLPANAIVLTHNPGMFHVWNVSAAQLSIATDTPEYVDQMFTRYAGGVYVHWNFWCNIHDRVQNAFCRNALDRYPHDRVDAVRERDYEYAFYRLKPRDAR